MPFTAMRSTARVSGCGKFFRSQGERLMRLVFEHVESEVSSKELEEHEKGSCVRGSRNKGLET